VDRFDERCLWWRHELLHRRALQDPEQLIPRFAPERAEVEARWREEPPTPSAAFVEADALLRSWTERVYSDEPHDRRPLWVRRYWQARDRRAGMPATYDRASGASV
jgi:hypothetical protein